MPVMDGIEATKEIRRLEKSAASDISSTTPLGDVSRTLTEPGKSAPSTPYHSSVIIVALTASSLQTDRVIALAAGCNDFLTKPVSLHWLDKKIIEWGSIKALQMWASPDQTRDLQSGQDARAQAIELRLPGTDIRSAPITTTAADDAKAHRPPPRVEAVSSSASTSKTVSPPGRASGQGQQGDVVVLGQNARSKYTPSIASVLSSEVGENQESIPPPNVEALRAAGQLATPKVIPPTPPSSLGSTDPPSPPQ